MNDNIEIKSATWLNPVLRPGGLKLEVQSAARALKS